MNQDSEASVNIFFFFFMYDTNDKEEKEKIFPRAWRATSRLTVPGLTDTLLHRNPGQGGMLSHQERPNSQ